MLGGWLTLQLPLLRRMSSKSTGKKETPDPFEECYISAVMNMNSRSDCRAQLFIPIWFLYFRVFGSFAICIQIVVVAWPGGDRHGPGAESVAPRFHFEREKPPTWKESKWLLKCGPGIIKNFAQGKSKSRLPSNIGPKKDLALVARFLQCFGGFMDSFILGTGMFTPRFRN